MQVLAPTFCALFALSTASIAHATDAPIILPAQGGSIRITPIFHGSLQIEYQGKVIQVDPFSQGDYSKAKKATAILITHTHGDHLDQTAIKQIMGGRTQLYGPTSVAETLMKARADGQPPLFPSKRIGAIMVSNGQYSSYATRNKAGQVTTLFRLQAVPMYNLKRGPKPGQKFHPKGEFNGYILTMGGKRIYIAGDTEATPEMKALKNIDIAFLPMNLPYTMTPTEAAGAVRAFKPKIAVPYHYRYPFDKANTNPQQFRTLLKGSKTQVVLRDWYRK